MYLGVMVVKHVVRSLIYKQVKTMKLYLIIYATFLLLQKQFLKKSQIEKVVSVQEMNGHFSGQKLSIVVEVM